MLQSKRDLGTGQGKRAAFITLVLYRELMACHGVNLYAEASVHAQLSANVLKTVFRDKLFTYNKTCIKNTLKYALSIYL